MRQLLCQSWILNISSVTLIGPALYFVSIILAFVRLFIRVFCIDKLMYINWCFIESVLMKKNERTSSTFEYSIRYGNWFKFKHWFKKERNINSELIDFGVDILRSFLSGSYWGGSPRFSQWILFFTIWRTTFIVYFGLFIFLAEGLYYLN